MRFDTVLTSIALATGLVSSLRTPKNLPNGLWSFSLDANGDTVAHSLDNPEQPDILARNDEPIVKKSPFRTIRSVGKLEERCCTAPGAYCNGYYLNHAGVDASGHDMENYLSTGSNDEHCEVGNFWSKGFVEDGVMVYICIDIPYQDCEIFHPADVFYALAQMDAACPAYMAGYYRFNDQNNLDPRIIGKVNSGDTICV